MNHFSKRIGAWTLLVLGTTTIFASPASAAGRWRNNANTRYYANSRPSNSQGWNASNTWYNHPSYGNYAPPPYATSKRAFYQVGPVPAPGGVRSLPGWGGAR